MNHILHHATQVITILVSVDEVLSTALNICFKNRVPIGQPGHWIGVAFL